MTMRNALRSLLLALACAVLVLPGCDVLGDDDDEDDGPPLAGDVVVGNGGVFLDGNGSLTFYDPASETTSTTDDLGGFVTGLYLNDDRVYAPLNSGGGLAVVNLDAVADGQDPAPTVYATTTGGRRIGSPRALAFPGDDRVYATDFDGGGQVTGFRLEDGDGLTALDDTVALPVAFPEGIAATAGKVFAANYGASGTGTSLTVFEPGDAESAREVDVPCDGPRDLFVDEEGELVVVCVGRTVFGEPDAPENSNARVLFMDPESETVVDEIAFDRQFGSINGAAAASYSATGEVLHAISSGTGQVFRIDTDANRLDGAALDVPATAGYQGLAAVAYDAARDRLYLARLGTGDAGGTRVEGQVVVLDGGTGALVETFETGIAPTSLLLVE